MPANINIDTILVTTPRKIRGTYLAKMVRVQLLLLGERFERRRALQLHDGLRVRQDVLGFVGGHCGAERAEDGALRRNRRLLRNETANGAAEKRQD